MKKPRKAAKVLTATSTKNLHDWYGITASAGKPFPLAAHLKAKAEAADFLKVKNA